MNRKGFTLVELLATIIVLAIVVGITVPITINGVNKAKKKEEDMLIANVKAAITNIRIECPTNDASSFCNNINYVDQDTDKKIVTLKELARLGYLSYDNTGNNTNIIIENPYNEVNPNVNCEIIKNCKDVSSCKVNIRDKNYYDDSNADKCTFLKPNS